MVACQSAMGADWRRSAHHLVGGGDGRRAQALRDLARHKSLDRDLRQALAGPDRFLALDVIAALKRKTMLDEIIRFSAADPTGFSYLTLNALVDKFNVDRLSRLYLERLSNQATTAPARVILIDTLARMKVALPEDFWSRLVREESPEVRSAGLNALKVSLAARPGDAILLNRLREFLRAPQLSRQLRIQALFLIQNLPAASRSSLAGLKLPCPDPAPLPLAQLCPSSRTENPP